MDIPDWLAADVIELPPLRVPEIVDLQNYDDFTAPIERKRRIGCGEGVAYSDLLLLAGLDPYFGIPPDRSSDLPVFTFDRYRIGDGRIDADTSIVLLWFHHVRRPHP